MKHFTFILLLFSLKAACNNIQVSNISLTGQNTTDNYTLVQFDLQWENSWRISSGPSNYDGAWVFIKFREDGGPWKHATINYVDGNATNDGHLEASGSTIKGTSDGVGAFIHRNAEGNGNVIFNGLQLRWNYGQDGVENNDIVDVKVFAIEMVYIPQGSYPLGSTSLGSEVDHFYTNSVIGEFTYLVQSEDEITVSPADGDLYYEVTSNENNGSQTGPIPAAFPKGYNAFWCMKYEMSEDQWISFFNILTEVQKLQHDITDANHKNSDAELQRNTISYISGNATTNAPARAVSYLSYEDNAAYYDWSGLRFLTELEYEKAAKGPNHIDDMLASGSTLAHTSLYTIVNDGQENAEISDPGIGTTNLSYFLTDPGGPMRVGIFAASAVNPTRLETGGSYYGVMELSGNLFERLIGVGTPINRNYTGNHGDGKLSNDGYHNVVNWPPVGGAGAIAYRGGSWSNPLNNCTVADRSSSALLPSVTNSRIGARGGRTAE